MKHGTLRMALVATLLLAGCGGSDKKSESGPRLIGDLAVPGITAGSTFSFDLGLVLGPNYYVTDRNNKAVDVVAVPTGTLVAQVQGGFTGCVPAASCVGANNGLSGPDGINAITGTSLIFVGDVDFVRVIDTTKGIAGQVVNNIRVGSTGFRADEGCFDPDDNIYMISSPDAPTPFASFINTTTQTVIATVQFTDPPSGVAAGLEQCQYDPGTKSFLVNNDGTTANPHGEVDVIPAALIKALAPGTTTTLAALGATVKRFPLGSCDPTGMALGPGTDFAVGCRPSTLGAPLITLILNRTNGSILAAVPFGGGDQLAYDPTSNRYYNAGSRWNASGAVIVAGGACSAAFPCNPSLGIIDAATRTLVTTLPTGNNAHSVAVDPVSGRIFVPYSSATAPAGCKDCSSFPNGGISIFTTN
jgi:hypothetical protein